MLFEDLYNVVYAIIEANAGQSGKTREGHLTNLMAVNCVNHHI